MRRSTDSKMLRAGRASTRFGPPDTTAARYCAQEASMAGFRLEVPRAALVITDPQSVERNHTVENIERLLQAAKRASMAVAISPLMDRVGLPIALDAPEQHGADFPPAFKPYFVDGRTLVASAHKAYGPERDDLAKRLRGAGVSQVVLAGMSANLCVESHLRALLESGFEGAVVEDATAAAALDEGDGYQAALVNFRYIADALWSTDEALRQI